MKYPKKSYTNCPSYPSPSPHSLQYTSTTPRPPSQIQTTTSRKGGVSFLDFPRRLPYYPIHIQTYLLSHNISLSFVKKLTTVYPTVRGLCYLLYGEVLYQIRITRPPIRQRFFVPKGGEFGRCVFLPRRRISPELVIVEGTTDALAVEECGFRAVSVLGSNITPAQVTLLKSLIYDPNKTIFIPDNDRAGILSITTLQHLRIPIRFLPPNIQDICEMKFLERREFLRQALSLERKGGMGGFKKKRGNDSVDEKEKGG